MITVLSGSNDFARSFELKQLINGFTAQYGDMAVERVDAAEEDFRRLLERVSAQAFLSDKRLVIVSNITINKDLSGSIEQLLDSVSETTEVVIDEAKFDKRSLLYKTLKKRTNFNEFVELDERQLTSWLVDLVKDSQGELSTNDAAYLVQRVGLSQMALSNELDKLLSYDKRITRAVINKLVEPLPVSTTFQLMDAAFSGNRKKTLELYQQQRLQQVEPQAIMGLVAWQVHAIAVVKANERISVEEIARTAKLNPFVVRKTLQLVRDKSLNEVKQLVSRTLQLDIRLKSQPIDADDALQYFLMTI